MGNSNYLMKDQITLSMSLNILWLIFILNILMINQMIYVYGAISNWEYQEKFRLKFDEDYNFILQEHC